jgi:Bacterial regulatory helix-turn-helix protein, lysR family
VLPGGKKMARLESIALEPARAGQFAPCRGVKVEIKWIEDFIALAQHQSFSRAAELRNVTQSGLSRRIQALEQSIGAELINRSTFFRLPNTHKSPSQQ